MRRPLRLLALLLAALPLAAPASAQFTDEFWEDTFAVPGAYGPPSNGSSVLSLARSGKDLYIGGGFGHVDDTEAIGIARWDGTRWHPVGGGLETEGRYPPEPLVLGLLAGSDGALYATGYFTHVVQTDGARVEANSIAKWDGADWMPLGRGLLYDTTIAGTDVTAYVLAEVGGRLYVGGAHFGGVNADSSRVGSRGLVRWNGATWESVGSVQGEVHTLLALPDGDLIVVGSFLSVTNPDGTTIPGTASLARWDGSAWHAIGGGLAGGGQAYALAFTEGEFYVGGSTFGFVQSDGTMLYTPSVARWDGTAWHALDGGTRGVVRALAPDGLGGVWVGGSFDAALRAGGDIIESPGLVRWTGSAWQPEEGVAPHGVHAILSEGPARIIVGGQFDEVREDSTFRPARNLARREADTWEAVSRLSLLEGNGLAGRGARVDALADGCGYVLAGGIFLRAGGVAVNGIGAWDRAQWRGFGGGLEAAEVQAIAPTGTCPNGPAFFVGGSFYNATQPDGSTVESPNVVLWDGAVWVPLGRGTDGLVNALAADAEGVFVVGSFSRVYDADGTSRTMEGIARWSPPGGWEPVGRGLAGFPYVAALGPDGALYVGGDIWRAYQPGGSALPIPNLARWTGTRWESIGGPSSTSSSAYAFSLAFDNEGRLVVGGVFDQITRPDGSVLPARNVARWDGQAWEPLGEGLSVASLPGVLALATGEGERIYAGGEFGFIENDVAVRRNVAVWDGGEWQPLGSGTDDLVSTLAFGPDEKLYVGGGFDVAGAIGSPGLAVWDAPAATPAEPGPGGAPTTLALSVAPNPVCGSTVLTLALPQASHVRLAVYDVLGREVAVLLDGERPAGGHEVTFDAGRLAPGVYVVRLGAAGGATTRTVTVVR